NVPQGTQSDQAYRNSFAANGVTNVVVTSQQVSCCRPEVPFLVNNGPNDGYTGEVPCPGATTNEDTGAIRPYPTQVGSQPPYPAAGPTMGHVPGYEGFTDNTDPVGAFDAFGNYYQALLPYQFFYDSTGHKNYEAGNEPNRTVPNEAVAVAVRPQGASGPNGWITTHDGHPDYVFTTNAGFGQEPDKEWIAIDRNPSRPDGSPNSNYNRIYM